MLYIFLELLFDFYTFSMLLKISNPIFYLLQHLNHGYKFYVLSILCWDTMGMFLYDLFVYFLFLMFLFFDYLSCPCFFICAYYFLINVRHYKSEIVKIITGFS